VDRNRNTLGAFRYQRTFQAEDGRPGGPKDQTGASAKSVLIPVPPGTMIFDQASGALIGDMLEDGQQLIVCRGGRGGRGNTRFKTSRNQAPRMAEHGAPGEEKTLRLELRLIADIGIIGVPNAGKSTLLSVVTNARPKIGAYPFTTLQPNLGVVELDRDVHMVLADIPGLIEGAHAGVGLGATFLRHILRTRVLIHLIDGAALDPLADFSQVNTELALFDPALAKKPQIVAINKIDMPEVADLLPELEAEFAEHGYAPMAVSGLAHKNLQPLLWAAYHKLQDLEPEEDLDALLPVYRPEDEPEAFDVTKEAPGEYRVRGKAIERAAAMTYWEYDEAVRRFHRILRKLGIEEALLDVGVESGDTVLIGEYELEWQE